MIGAFAASATETNPPSTCISFTPTAQAALGQRRLELVEVRRDDRLARGVQDGGHHPLVLAVDGGELARTASAAARARARATTAAAACSLTGFLNDHRKQTAIASTPELEQPLDAGAQLVRIGLAQHVAV